MAKFPHPNSCGGISKPLPSFGRPHRLIWLVCEYFTDFFPLCSTHKSHNYTHQHSGADGTWEEVQATPSIELQRNHGTALTTGCPMVRPDAWRAATRRSQPASSLHRQEPPRRQHMPRNATPPLTHDTPLLRTTFVVYTGYLVGNKIFQHFILLHELQLPGLCKVLKLYFVL